MDIARRLLNVCGKTGVSNIQIVTSPWKEGKGITLLAKADDKPILSVKMDTAYEKYNPQSESIRIRLPYQLEHKLISEKNRTGKSVSQITREALAEYFRKR